MVAQPGSSALFTGKHSYFESPDKPDSSAVKRARISIQEVSPVDRMMVSAEERQSEMTTFGFDSARAVIGVFRRVPQSCMEFTELVSDVAVCPAVKGSRPDR